MCGFAGVIAWDERYRTTRQTLARMSAAIAHRGPDGEGVYFNHEEPITPDRPQCALAFRRLAILDPDPRSNQPFTIGHKTLVFNGEIYNFRDLRKELTQLRPDYAWRTSGDTEVLLLAFDVWGDKCVEHLNGMFAFAVWDEAEKSLFLARDRMGQKPLYVAVATERHGSSISSLVVGQKGNVAVAFASEICALRSLKWVNHDLCLHELNGYLQRGYCTASIYQGIGQIYPRTTVSIGRNHTRNPSYFDVYPDNSGDLEALKVSDDQAPVRARRGVLAAVLRQVISDVPIGCFLSGGVDSAVIAFAMTSQLHGHSVHTFSAGFEDTRYDESQYAIEVAQHLGTNHTRFVVKPDVANDLPKLAAAFSEPFGDSSALPTHYLSMQTAQHVKVCLSGDGGDELFGGYDRYRAMMLAARVRSATPSVLLSAAARSAKRSKHGGPKGKFERFRRFLESCDLSDEQRYETYMSLDGRRLNSLFADSYLESQGNRISNLGSPLIGFQFRFANQIFNDSVRAALEADRRIYLKYDLLTKVDRCSMMHGLEVRSPFMDHELVQFAAGLTTDQLLKGGPKRMLREAFAEDLPDFVFKRKKMGFAVPIGEWFRRELRPMLRDHLFAADSFAAQHFNRAVVERLVIEHEQSRVDHSQRLYALLMLELWWKTCR